MKPGTKSKGRWIHRFAIWLFTFVFAVLLFWVLGFFVDDIRDIPGPDYSVIEKKHLDANLAGRQISLEKQISDISRQIANQVEKQRVLGDSSLNLQQTIDKLIELQKLGMQKNADFSEIKDANFANTLTLFLENQKKYQELSQIASDLLERKQALVRETEQAEQEIKIQCRSARDEFNKLDEKHRLKLAFFQLAILLPILVAAATLIIKKRSSIYFPFFLAFGAATLLKVALVAHEYFPSRYFKYILIGGLLVAVAKLLIHFVRTIAFPKTQWLIKQYREAYERFLCPVCEYPIRIGPRRYLFWTRRTVNKLVVSGEHATLEEKYTCPACGAGLFEECPACHKVRHALLPNCLHCGVEKEIK